MSTKRTNFINIQDPDGFLRGRIDTFLAEYKKKHPAVMVTISSVTRMAIDRGLDAMKEEQRATLGDKLTRGAFKK